MELTLQPDIELDLSIVWHQDARTGTYIVVGPEQHLQMLEEVISRNVVLDLNQQLVISGLLSPLSPVTLAGDPAGVPAEAAYVAFAYPGHYSFKSNNNADGTQPLEHAIDKALQTVNLADERWAFLLLVGGFCYFNGNFQLIQVNALTLVPTGYTLNFKPPVAPSVDALRELRSRGRMMDVTLEALNDAGFAAFGWVLPHETVNGHPFTDIDSYPYGAFIYEMKSSAPTLFVLTPHTQEQIHEFHQLRSPRIKSRLRSFFKQATGITDRNPKRSKTKLKRAHTEWVHENNEHSVMKELTAGLSGHPFKHQSQVRLWLLPSLAVCSGAIPVVALLLVLGYANPVVFDMVSTWLWYAVLVANVQIPLQDTAGLALNNNDPNVRSAISRFNVITSGVAFLMAFIFAIVHIPGLEEERENVRLIAHILGIAVIYVDLPLVVYSVRRRTAAQLERNTDSRVTSKTQGSDVRVVRFTASPRVLPATVETAALSQADGDCQEIGMASPPQARDRQSNTNDVQQGRAEISIRASQIKAVTRLQSKVRSQQQRARFQQQLIDRQARLRYFSWPIFLATLFDIVGNIILLELESRGHVTQHAMAYSLLLAVPSFVVALRDLLKPYHRRPRFSLAHAIFFVAVLHRFNYKAVPIDSMILDSFHVVLGKSAHIESFANSTGYRSYDLVEVAAPLLTMASHLALFVCVMGMGKATLTLVAAPNACPHLLFPFQFFEFVYIYSFFMLRQMDEMFDIVWILQQVLLQVHIILRNSGLLDAMKKHLRRTVARLLCMNRKSAFEEHDPAQDPLLWLQYLARLSWQYDIADIAALIITPCVVSLFIFRDGFYSVQGTGILVLPCHIHFVWLHFSILLIIKPAASTVARCILARAMRKTMLGKATIHGTSRLAAKILAERRMVKTATIANVDDKVVSAFDFVKEELEAVKSELSVSGLDFAVLRVKQMRKWRFYLAVIILQLFSAFQVHATRPYFNPDVNNVITHITDERLPISLAWDYVPPVISIAIDADLSRAFAESNAARCQCKNYTTGRDQLGTASARCQDAYTGWPQPHLTVNLTSSSASFR